MRMSLLALPLLLAACGTEAVVVRSTQHMVVMPEESLFNCPTVDQMPATRNLTDVQVARLIVQLYQNNTTCKNSMTSIRKFLEDARNATTPANQEQKR
jgi:hypothetical protein